MITMFNLKKNIFKKTGTTSYAEKNNNEIKKEMSKKCCFAKRIKK